MNTTAIANQVSVRAADLPLERLATNPNVTTDEKVGELSRQFETLLLRQILQQAQKTVFASKYHSDTFAGGIYQDMVAQNMAEGISKTGTVGLAHSLDRQLIHQTQPHPDAAAAARSLS